MTQQNPPQLNVIYENKLCLVLIFEKSTKHVMQDYHDITHICRRCSYLSFLLSRHLNYLGRGGVASSREHTIRKMFHQDKKK